MKSQFALQTFFLKGTDVCKSYHINTFLDVMRTRYCKVFDFGMSQYSTSGWHSNYYSEKAKCDIDIVAYTATAKYSNKSYTVLCNLIPLAAGLKSY